MPEHRVEVRKILWTEAVPPMRLLSTFWRAFAFGPMAGAFAFIVIAVILGRVLDAVWIYFGNGAVVAVSAAPRNEELRTEIDAFSVLDSTGYREWRRVMAAGRGATAPEAADPQRVADARTMINQRMQRGLDQLGENEKLSRAERSKLRTDLRRRADVIRFQLAGKTVNPYPEIDLAEAIETVLAADSAVTVATRSGEAESLRDTIRRVQAAQQWRSSSPRGPFAALTEYEMHCASAAVRGAVTGRWGLQASARAPEPALLGSALSGARGLLWLCIERPWYALLFGVLLLVTAAPLAGMACRLVAITIAREEQGENRKAYAFMSDRRWALVGAPLTAIGLGIGIALLVSIGGVFGAIPYVGPLLSGAMFFLALLGGLAAALFVLVLVCGFPLMWPTIAVEGSDAFDALQRGGMYTLVRPGLAGLCYLVLFLNWTVAVLAARAVAMLALKITHCAADAGMSLFRSSAETSTIGRLEAMWWMPAWQDLSLLPNTGDEPFWGVLRYGPLSGDEQIGAFLIGIWVFVVVGAVAAFAVAFALAGMTETYFVLRRAIDGTDYAEIYFEHVPDEYSAEAPQPEAPAATTSGKPLPVVTPPAS
jgi:hypothetical protein